MALIFALAACGGGKSSSGDTTPDDTTEDTGEDVSEDGTGDEMIPPERMDEITRTLDRKRNSSGTRCIEQAIDNGELKKNARGTLSVNFVITRAGGTKEVEITQNSFDESPMMTDCIVALMADLAFGELPRDLPWSYKFRFEAF